MYYLRQDVARYAIDTYKKFLIKTYSFTPGAEAYHNCSLAYYALGKMDSALIQINETRDQKQLPEYYSDSGTYYAENGDLENALSDFSKAIELDPTLIGAYNNRASYIWFQNGDYQKAVEDLTRVINLEPNDAFAYSNRAYAYYKLKDFENAFLDAFKSVELENRNPYVYRVLALLYDAIDEKDEAKNAVEGAISWGLPTDGDEEFEGLMKKLGLTK